MKDKKFYVYIDFTLEGIPFYVGKGNLIRVGKVKRNRKHSSVSNKYGFFRQVVFFTDCEQTALDTEIYYIECCKTFYEKSQYGCNFTLGGEGVSGLKQSKEHKEKLRLANMGNKYTLGKPPGNKGKKASEELKKNYQNLIKVKNFQKNKK